MRIMNRVMQLYRRLFCSLERRAHHDGVIMGQNNVLKRLKKVLFFLPGGVGGAERMTLTIGSMLPRDEYEVKFVVVGRMTDILKIIPKGYEVIRLRIHNKYCAPVTRMMAIMMKEKPDFTFSSVMYLNIRVLIASRLMGVRCIIRNDNYLEVVDRRMRWELRHVYPLAYRIIAQQEEMAENLIQGLNLNPGKVVVCHNPLDTERITRLAQAPSPYPEDGVTNYLWIGNFLKTKGHDVLVKAFKTLHDSNPQTHLYLIGTTPPDTTFRDSVFDYVKENGLLECVHFMGFQENPYKFIKNCDCYVLPSRIEGLPNSLIEAMYLNRPVVATRCIPIISRMIKDGVNGYTTEVEDVGEMAKRMQDALHLTVLGMIYKPGEPEIFIKLFK